MKKKKKKKTLDPEGRIPPFRRLTGVLCVEVVLCVPLWLSCVVCVCLWVLFLFFVFPLKNNAVCTVKTFPNTTVQGIPKTRKSGGLGQCDRAASPALRSVDNTR